VDGYYTDGTPGLDFLDKFSQATGNAQAPDRESVRYACIWKAAIMLFSRYKVVYEKKRKIMRNLASVAELKKSFFAEIDKVEKREDLEKLRVKYLGREKGILAAVLRSLGGMPLAKRKEPQSHLFDLVICQNVIELPFINCPQFLYPTANPTIVGRCSFRFDITRPAWFSFGR
jgi:hypothetical protein